KRWPARRIVVRAAVLSSTSPACRSSRFKHQGNSMTTTKFIPFTFPRRRLWLTVCLLLTSPAVYGQVLLVDEFDDTQGPISAQGDGIVDISKYRAPFGGTANDAFVGRTAFRFTLPQEGVATAASGSADGKVAVLKLDTYNPDAPGASFLGTDLISK